MESISELKRIVEKGIKRSPGSAMYFIEPIQVYVTKVLLLMKFNRISTSFLWLFVGIVSALFFISGNVKFGMIAIVLHYFETILDGCDGQVARYNKRKLSERDDHERWFYGLYLDFTQHIIIDTFQMAFFALGLFKISGNFFILVAGIILIYLRMYKRTRTPFLYRIASTLRKRKEVFREIEVKDVSDKDDKLIFKIIDKMFFWIKNGKFLFLLLLSAHVLDLIVPGIIMEIEFLDWGVINFRIILLFSISIIGTIGVVKELVFDIVYGQGLNSLKEYIEYFK